MVRKKRKRKPTKTIEEEDTSNLPWEVIYIILSKLPVKSLLRFRCVCKPWLTLISEPQFIKSHLTESINSGRRQRVICSVLKSDCFYNVDYETCDGKSESEEELLYFPIKKYRKASVLCSCNGLVLLGLHNDKMHVLWNPSTREYKRFSCPSSEICFNSYHQICYDSSIDEYKYKVLIINWDGIIMVYKWKTNSWTETKGGFPYLRPDCDGVIVSGVPHWIVALKKGHNLRDLLQIHGLSLRGGSSNNSLSPSPTDNSDSNHFDKAVHKSCMIACFDLVEDKIREVPTPMLMGEGDLFHLTVMRGCLGLYINSSDRHHVHVWVMEEYGVRSSWTKHFTIPLRLGSTYLYHIKPVCYTKKGEVVLMGSSTIVLYDPKENKLRKTIHPTGTMKPSSVVSYVDSLVLPTRD